VALEDSGVDWLGDVPEHWEVLPLKRRWSVKDCKHLTVPFVEDEDSVPLASVREVQSFDLSLDTAKRTSWESYQSLIEGDRRPKSGDLIYCRNVSVGAAAVVTADGPLAMGQDVCLIRSHRENQRYLNYFLKSQVMHHQLAMLMIGSTFNRINVEDIKALTIVVPPRHEQDAIAHYLDAETKQLGSTQRLAEEEISLIREYRTRLIADVVTGKLDVRQVAGQLSEDVEEVESREEEDVEHEGADRIDVEVDEFVES
jgi:type I restriction enzyme S subunit